MADTLLNKIVEKWYKSQLFHFIYFHISGRIRLKLEFDLSSLHWGRKKIQKRKNKIKLWVILQ